MHVTSDTVRDKGNYLALGFVRIVAFDLGLCNSLCNDARIIPALGACAFVSVTRTLALNENKLPEFILVNGHALFFKYFLCEIYRESECVLKLKCVLGTQLL